MNRRGFLGTCLALAAAPAIVRASSLMPGRGLIVPSLGLYSPDGTVMNARWLEIPEGESIRIVQLGFNDSYLGKVIFDNWKQVEEMCLGPLRVKMPPTMARMVYQQ